MMIFLCILIVLGYFFPRSKVLFLVMGMYLMLTIGLRTHGFDYNIYEIEYSTAPFIYYKNADFPGWNLLMNFFNDRSILFQQFVLIIAILCVILLLFGIYRLGLELGGYISFALCTFLIYPFGHEAVQMRTFLADSLICVALSFLLKDTSSNKKKNLINYIFYFILVWLASSIHTLAYYFIMIGLIYIILRSFHHELKLIISGSIILTVLISTGFLSQAVTGILNSNKLDHWVAMSSFSFGKFIPMFITVLLWVMVTTEINELKSNVLISKPPYIINVQRFMNTIFLLVPLMSYDITFDRLWRVYLIVFYLVTGEYLYTLSSKGSRKKILIFCLFFLLIGIIFIYENELNILLSFI